MAVSRTLRRLGTVFLALLVVGVLTFLMGPRVTIPPFTTPAFALPTSGQPAELDAYFAASEAKLQAVKPGLEKGIVWADPANPGRTQDVIVSFHGFSASRLELSPTVENVAKALNANIFFARLTGHGMSTDVFGDAKATDWFVDAEEALATARLLGDRVIVIGCSTGSTLGLWLASRHPEIHAQVMISPNFSPRDKRSQMLLWPWGLNLAKAIIGERRTWKPDNPRHGEVWTHDYKVEVLLQVMALVKLVNELDLSSIQMPTLMLYSPKDDVIDLTQIPGKFEALGAKNKKLIEVVESPDHVMSGDIISPQSTDVVVGHIVSFLKAI